MALLTPAFSSPIVLRPALSPFFLFPARTTLPRPCPRAAPFLPLSIPAAAPTSLKLSASLSPPPSVAPPKPNALSDSTRTVATVVGSAVALSKLFAHALRSLSARLVAAGVLPSPDQLLLLQRGFFATAGPLFFARLRDRPTGYLNTPLTVVAAGLAKWLDIYSGVLMVRVLLSWFPNIPWERQPLSAIRDLCDPYLNLFRNIIPPIFDTLDVSPLLAFAVLGCLGAILNGTRASY